MRRFLLALGLLFSVVGIATAQKTVTGTVIDEEGESLIGVSILVKGTTTGTVTDLDGAYAVSVPTGAEQLIFSYTGYGTQEVAIDNRSVVNVTMASSAELLDEVIVTAYGVTSKEAFGGSADVIGAEDLEVRNVTSVVSALEGKATGVQFTSGTGGPGSSPNVFIRGIGTLNGSARPLYVVDGVQYEGDLSTINQEDIASLTVLKDASSTSLYGSRGANGVILITTKRGSRKGTRVSASVSHGLISNAIPFYDEVTPGEYYETMWEALRNSSAGGGDPQFASDNIFNSLGYNPFNVPNDQIVGTDGQLNPNAEVIYQSLDWYDQLQQDNPTRTNYALNVSSGGEDHSIFFSTSYLEEDSYVRTSEYDRFTSRVNADFDATDWLTIGGSANVVLTNAAGPSSAGTGSIVNPFGFAKNIGSIYPVFVNDRDGNLVRDAGGDPIFDSGEGFSEFGVGSRPINQGRHALQELLLNDERDRDNTYGFRFYSDLHLLKGLKLSLIYGRDINEGLEKEYENAIIGDAQPTGRYSETRFRRQTINFNQILNYTTSFSDVHNFEVLLGHESFDRTFSFNDVLAIDQVVEGIFEFDNFATPVSTGGATSQRTLEGYFAKLNYNYANKYYASFSARRDGSSVLLDNRWGNFFAGSLSWRLDQEQFIQDISWINRLKLRGSYGQVGNDNLNDFFLSRALYALSSNAGNPGLLFSEIGNAGLVWESTNSFDVALEFTILDNLLDGSVEYYNRETSNLLYDLPIALSNGANAFPGNVGGILNSGVEVGLQANLLRKGDLRWSVNTTLTTLHNEITDLPEPFVNGSKRWEEGRSRYDYYILHTAGVDPENGDQLFLVFELDEDGNSVPVLEEDGTQAVTNDWQATERAYTNTSSLPDLLGSVSTNLNYKGFGLNILMNYGIGGEILDFGYSAMMHSGNYGSSLHPDILNAWRAPGDVTDVPRLENGNSPNLVRASSTRFLTSASFWAIRNVNLSYTFDRSVTDRIGLDDLRVSLTGENLFISSERNGLNPQFNLAGTPSGNTFSPSRVISVGLNANF
ncbi:SusC/RagA family TonB-linked outer membrane protein [Lewinella sp. 4G2]|uniref:SusC/RagA family TonB-linked outer membrane protein n=1 Tax=Lewinella sp. 4G2 TaxID=1803372 RepID=UPI0007B47085|nr:SusC/RagA family TonB-linked outer membrane protein [Lewinella sp. 4G2]OAV44541.1 SusC/RagA family protein [Lewinella sp. 4G2]